MCVKQSVSLNLSSTNFSGKVTASACRFTSIDSQLPTGLCKNILCCISTAIGERKYECTDLCEQSANREREKRKPICHGRG
jgi:hypothetical protein